MAQNVNSYTFYTSVRPLNITITRTNYLPYLATIGGSLNSSITFSDVTHLFGNFTSKTNAKIVIEPNTKIILPDGTSREFESKTVLKGKDINNLSRKAAKHRLKTKKYQPNLRLLEIIPILSTRQLLLNMPYRKVQMCVYRYSILPAN